MKTKYRHILLFVFWAVSIPAFNATYSRLQVFSTDEKVILFTDRSIYISGEKIQFSATIISGYDTKNKGQSSVIYCELITPDGRSISNHKYLTTNSIAVGCLAIPGDILTGTYYFRAYTKLMRNNGPESYGYRQIRIVNPGRNEILTSDSSQNISAMQILEPPTVGLKDPFVITIDKAAYSKRNTIRLSIQPDGVMIDRIKNICVSVIPEGTKIFSNIYKSAEPYMASKQDYYPETHGLSLTGKLTDAASANPLPGKKVNLSIIGDGRDFLAVCTDSSGRFFFALPAYYGSRDLFICAEKAAKMNVKIWVDNDLCTAPIHLPSPEFKLSELEKQIIIKMNLNVQINSRFYNDSLPETQIIKKEESEFYDQPSVVLCPDNYVSLPTLTDYLNELPSQVKVRRNKGETHFEVFGTRGLSFYDPLVLVDWVAVDEPARILAASPQNIARIEIVNEDYMKGGQTYGGIISFISKKGDFAGIDLPSAGIFVSYRFLSENQCNVNNTIPSATLPDSRNTILWKPAVSIEKGKPGKIIFTAPDTPGRYSVVMEGTTTNGEVFVVTSGFEIN